MISLAGLLGRAVAFVIEKLADKKLGDTLDDRRRCARTLISFYDALTELEKLTIEFVDVLEKAKERGRIYARWVAGFDTRVEAATKRFAREGAELYQVIQIHDPVLARTLGKEVVSAKFGVYAAASRFLGEVGTTFQTTWTLPHNRGLEAITLTLPDRSDLTWFDLEAIYTRARNRANTSRSRGSTGIFGFLFDAIDPSSVQPDYLDELLENRIVGVSIGPTDTEVVADLHALLSEHELLLSNARKQLAEFIASRFSVAELLFVQPRRDEH